MGGGGEVRQERLYLRLTCAQLVLSPLSASSSNGQVLHLVWGSLRALMTLKSPKKVKHYSRKSRGFKNHAKVNAYFTDHEKIENQFPEDGKI